MNSEFPRDYEYEVLNELPGIAASRHFYYPGASTTGGADGLIVRVRPNGADPWLGTFAFGMFPIGPVRVLTTPNPGVVCVVAKGDGYLVTTTNPARWETVRSVPVLDVRQVHSHDLLVFADFTGLIAYGKDGVMWDSGHIGADELKVVDVSSDEIRGTWWNPATGKYEEFAVAPSSGKLVRGTRWMA